MNERPDEAASPSASELAAVAELWKRERRIFTTAFGGTSMLPSIAPGQQVTVQCGIEPEIGEVVMFLRDGQMGVHRLAARLHDAMLTWGDANPLPDDPVEPARVVGTIRDAPRFAMPEHRRALLRWLGAAPGDAARARRRLRLAYRLRGALAAGPVEFARKAFRALARAVRR